MFRKSKDNTAKDKAPVTINGELVITFDSEFDISRSCRKFNKVTLVDIDLDKLTTRDEANLIFSYVEENKLHPGDVIPAGELTITDYYNHRTLGVRLNAPIAIGAKLTAEDIQKPENKWMLAGLYKETCSNRKKIQLRYVLQKLKNNDGSARYVINATDLSLHAEMKANTEHDMRVCVQGKKIGDGGFSYVYEKSGTIKQDRFSHGVSFTPKAAIRVHKNLTNASDDEVKAEDQLMSRLGYFGNRLVSVKDTENRKHVVLSQYRFSGEMLFDILENDRKARNAKAKNQDYKAVDILTLADRFQLAIFAMRELSRNIHAKNVKHLDVKDRNIMAGRDASSLWWNVKLIDLGLGSDVNEVALNKGTLTFIAPEFGSSLTIQSDIYSLGRVVGLIFADEEWHEFNNISTMGTLFNDLQNNKTRQLKLFNEINLPDEIKSTVSTIIHSMIAYEPDKRIALEKAIKGMRECFLTYIIGFGIYQEKSLNGLQKVGQLAAKLDEILSLNCARPVVSNPDIKDTLSKTSKEFAAAESRLSLVMIFKRLMGIICFRDCETFEAVGRKIESVLSEFNDNYEALNSKFLELQEMTNQNADKELNDLYKGCEPLLQRVKACPLDFDMMCHLTEHMKRKLEKITVDIQKFSDMQNVNEQRVKLA